MTPKPPAKAPAATPTPAPAAAPAAAPAPPAPTPAPKKLTFASRDHAIASMDAKRVEIAKLEKGLAAAKAELDEMIRVHNLK